jgi:hypothetical protein
VASGGTGVTDLADIQAEVLPDQSGQAGNYLTTDGTTASWTPPGSGTGTVTSVDVDGGTTGLTFSGGPVTSFGTITLGGTLAVASGGTGATDLAGLQAAAVPSQTGEGGKYLTTDGTVTSWATIAAGGTVTSVDADGGTTGLTFTGGPVTTSGTVTLGGTLSVATVPSVVK